MIRILSKRRLALAAASALAALAPSLGRAQTGPNDGPKVVNIINFIRGVEPRATVDLLEPVRQQIALAKQHNLPTTFLLQYDALINPDFVNLLKSQLGPNDEIGAWLEVVQPQVESAGMTWKGRWSWDYNTAVGLTQSYPPEDRKKLMDVYMAKFKDTFGTYPKSVGCWVLDAPTLNYLSDQYHIVAACNCKDQTGTDGYTLWGGYWNQAFYPSRTNAYMPAQTASQQLNVPIFRMLGSDPIYQYDNGLGGNVQGVVSLEPIYSPGGGSPSWVNWFFNANFNAPCLSFAYTQVGQENSFGWPAMQAGLTNQYQVLDNGVKAGTLRVETLSQSGTWFRNTFAQTPSTAVTALTDSETGNHKSIWYESRFYRVNLFWDGTAWRIRDLHIFNEKYPERYMQDHVTGPTCTYDTLPVMDGFNWSTNSNIAGLRPLVNTASGTRQLMSNGTPVVTEPTNDSMLITMPVTGGGELRIHCNPTNLSIETAGTGAPADWGMEMAWDSSRATSIVNFTPHTVGYQNNSFGYALRTADASVSQGTTASSYLIKPSAQTVTFDFDPANATSYWDLNGSDAGTGGATASGTWDATSAQWNASADGTGTPVAWQGAGHTAIFSAGSDATGASMVNVSGTQTADGVIVNQGQITLSGGALNLTTPAMIRAETGSSLTIGSQLTGNAGLLLGGDGAIQISGLNPISGPLGITATALTLASGSSFPALTDLSLANGVNLTANNTTLGLSGALNLTGAALSAKGTTTITGKNSTLVSDSALSLANSSSLTLSNVAPAESTFEIDGGSLTLSDNAVMKTDRWINRGSNLTQALNVSGNASLTVTDDLIFGDFTSAAMAITQTGGTVTNTGTTNNPGGDDASNRWALWGGGNTVYNISGGSLNLTGAPLYLSWDGSAALNISGTATVNLKAVEMGWGARSQTSSISLTGGRLNLGSGGITAGTLTNKSITLGGGTLGASAAWSSSVPMAVNGATTVDTGSFSIALSGILSGSGSLTKTGYGTLALSGVNTLTAPVQVNAGTVRIGGTTTAVSVGSAGNVGAGSLSTPGSGTVSTLDLATGSTSAFRIGTTSDSLTVSASAGLRPAGNHVINVIPASGAAPGTYSLFRYSGGIGGSGFASFTLASNPRVTASLVNNTANSSIDLVVTAVQPATTSGVFIQELFDGIAGTPPGTNSSLNGKGDTATSLGFTGAWTTTGSTGIYTASNFDSGTGIPGLPANNGVTGGLWNNTNAYTTTIYATRPLAAPVDFSKDQTLYFSFRANNSGDTAMGVGFSSGAATTSEFVGAGLSWNNARALATGAVDSGNAAYVAYGTLGANSGPYGIRNHEPLGSANGPELIVGRLTLHATGADQIDIKRYAPGDTIESDPTAVTWTASDSYTTSMQATNLLLWLNGQNGGAAGELDAIRVGKSWTDVTGALNPYDAWTSGEPFFLAGSDALPGADPDQDGIPNAIEFIIGGDPTDGSSDRAKLPTGVAVGGNFEFTFRRTAASNVTPKPFVEYGSDLAGWTAAQDGTSGVAVVTTTDYYAPGIDRVVAKIPLSLANGQRLFVRLNSGR